MAKNVLPFLEDRADDVAVTDEFGELTFAEANAKANQLIHGLRGLGVGDLCGLLVGNRWQSLVTINALPHCGMTQVPLNWHFAAEEVAYVLDDSESTAIVADAEHAELAVESAERASGIEHKIMFGANGDVPDGWVDFDELLASQPETEPDDQVSGSTMFYTSGTTGRPKGVKSSLLPIGEDPEIVQTAIEGLAGLMQFPRDGKTLVMAPMYHSGPFVTIAIGAGLGNQVVLTRKFDPEEMLRLIQEHRIESVYAVPTFFARLLKLPEDVREKYDVSSVEYVWHTAAPCPPDVKQAMMDWWGPVIHEGYGATEGTIPVWATPEQWLEKPGTVGKLVPIFEMLVIGQDGEQLGPNEVGQLYFRSLLGVDFEYHNAPAKTEDVHLEPGVFTFGDVGYVDDDGFVFLSDRKIDMIISGGVNIYPAEIESTLINHPKVKDAAVFGIPNDEFGEEVKAVVEPAEGETASDELAKELQTHCREHLAGYKVPRSIDFGELPRTATGKLVKRRLRDPYWEGVERRI